MIEELRYLTLLGATGVVRKEMLDGEEHLVLPIVALVEGAIRAINAPTHELVTAEKFSLAPSAWDGRPVFINHPMDGNTPVSGNSPDVLRTSIGKVFNTRVDGKRLLMEAWINPNKCTGPLGAQLLSRIAKGTPIEISTGAHVKLLAETGKFGGVEYKGKWDVILPDHLAILEEGTRGACSVAMGCGVRAAAAYKVVGDKLEEVKFEVLGGPGSGNWGHGPQGAPAGHAEAADKHLTAAHMHDNAATLGTDTSTRHAEEGSRLAGNATKQTGAKPFGSQAATMYAKLALNAKDATSRTTYHQMAASYHRSAASQHTMAGKFTPRNSKEGSQMSVPKLLRDLVQQLKAEIRGNADPTADTTDAGDPASLIVYEALTTLVGNATSALSKSDELIADLMAAAEAYDEEDEEACEMACARLNALEAMSMTVYSSMNGIMDAVRQQRRDWQREQNSTTVTISPNVYRGAAGKEISKKNMETIQAVHDHTVALGADCVDPGNMKAAAAGCGCGGHTTLKIGGEGMTKDERITALMACEHSPVRDKAVLTACSDGELTQIEAHAATGAKYAKAKTPEEIKALAAPKVDTTAADAKKKQDEEAEKLRASSASKTTEELEAEYLKTAPESLRTLIADTKARNLEEKTALLKSLSSKTGLPYTKEELEAKDVKELNKIATLAGVNQPVINYGLNGPRIAAEAPAEVAAAPDGYAMAIAAEKK